ncbi:hypothetical protein EDD86DRAFT_268452, partial [Gorgonomyces haynaldii]
MGYLTSGEIYYQIPKFDNPLDYVALVLVIAIMLADIICMIQLWSDLRSGKYYAKLLFVVFSLCIVWNIFKLVYVYTLSPPWVNFVYTTLGALTPTLGVLVDGEVLKAFCVVSDRIKPEMIKRNQYGVMLVHLTLNLGTYLRVISIGKPFPMWLDYWYNYGYILYCAILQLYELWQIVILIWLAIGQLTNRQTIMNSDADLSAEYESTNRRLRWMIGALVTIVTIQWVAGGITVVDFLSVDSKINNQIIGNTLAVITPILSFSIFTGIQHMSLRKQKKTSKKTGDPSKHDTRRDDTTKGEKESFKADKTAGTISTHLD